MGKNLSGNLVIFQSGGPTAVINSSLVGVIEEAHRHSEIQEIYGAINGILGILNRRIVDLKREDPGVIAGLRKTPAAGLGSCRYKLRESDVEEVCAVLQDYGIRYLLVNGGNDSMDTANKILSFAEEIGYELRVIGIPKTIDNDLPFTDHCPGYGSIGRWLAIATMDAGRDTEAIHTTDRIKIIETMGRNSGWVAATTAMAKVTEMDAPHLIYFPEILLSIDKLLSDVENVCSRLGYAVIVVGEGLCGEDAKLLVESKRTIDTDGFGHRQPGGVGHYLAQIISDNLDLKSRSDKPGTIQRASILLSSPTDVEEAYRVGQMAVRYAVSGKSGCMVTLERSDSPSYEVEFGLVELGKVANQVRCLPAEFINESKNFVSGKFVDYFRPLLGGPLPRYERLRKYFVVRP